MSDWFTVEEIDSGTFAISEYKHWEQTHCYLLCGNSCAALIDTGLGVSDIRRVVDGLTALPVMVVTTHAHWDHIGGHGRFEASPCNARVVNLPAPAATACGCIAVHEAEADWLSVRFPIPLEAVKRNLLRGDCDFPADFDIDSYHLYHGTPQRILRDGDVLDLGGRELHVIHTPGHSPGHCCFYEPERGYMYCGDLIYMGRLDAFYPTTDPVLFYSSVSRVRGYDVKKLLPGHYRLDIPTTLTAEIEAVFAVLSVAGQLRHGAGTFDFGDFSIRI